MQSVSLEDQARAVNSAAHWQKRSFTRLQMSQLEAAQRTLNALAKIRSGLTDAVFDGEVPDQAALVAGLLEVLGFPAEEVDMEDRPLTLIRAGAICKICGKQPGFCPGHPKAEDFSDCA